VILESELELPDSIATYGKSDFETILADELSGISYDLPLQHFCDRGGWPDDDSLEIEIKNTSRVGNTVTVTVGVAFTELVSTGCADIDRHESAFGEFDVFLNLSHKKAFIDYDSDCDSF
jgi:hypothetical protein